MDQRLMTERAGNSPSRDTLTAAVDVLIARYGLSAVYENVRKRDGFCNNCGCPLEPADDHIPGGFGHCVIKPASEGGPDIA